MATRYAIATGNWSSTSTWDGGTLPTSADDVYANNKTVTIDQNITVVSLRNAAVASPVISAGGSFQTQTSGTRTISANVIATGGTVLNVQGTCNCTLTGNVTGGSSGSNYAAVTIANYGNLGSSLSSYPVFVLNGNTTGGSVGGAVGVRLWGGAMTINGAITGGTVSTGATGVDFSNSDNQPGAITINTGPITGGSSSSGSTYGLSIQTTPTGSSLTNSYVNINCNIVGGSLSGSNYGVNYSSNVPVVVTGNCQAPSVGTGFFYNGTVSGCTINGNCQGGLSSGVSNNTSGTITLTGDITGGTGSSIHGLNINNGLVISNGTITGGVGSTCYGVNVGNSGRITHTGNVFGGPGPGAGSIGIVCNSASSLGTTINGNVTGVFSNCLGVANINIGAFTVNGNATGGASSGSIGARNDSTGTITINGSAIAGSTASGASNLSTGTLIVTKAVGNGYGVGSTGIALAWGVVSNVANSVTRVKQIELGSLGAFPITGAVTFIDDTSNSITMPLSTSGTKTLVDPNSTGLMPSASNVRLGTTYASGNSTGTMAVPAAGSVALGVSVDNTTGTAVLTQSNVWDYSLASASATSGSVGEKLKKTANTSDIIALG